MKVYIFKVRGIKQELELQIMSNTAARKQAKTIFTDRGFVDLKLSEVIISKY